VSRPPSSFGGPVALVPGELRGYRRFWLADDGLHPTVHGRRGTWSGAVEHARCAAGESHAAPAADCGCGLYGWYHPSDAGRDMGLGDVPAVIAARGRVVLGDHGFRAAAARVEAVALSRLTTPGPRSRRRAREVLARHYPHARVYGSRRAMLRAHRPHDLSTLGIRVRPSPVGRYRRTTYAVGVLGLVTLYLLLPVLRSTGAPTPLLMTAGLVLFVAWQVALVWLATRSTTMTGSWRETAPQGQDDPAD
jgi:hypothetical protein